MDRPTNYMRLDKKRVKPLIIVAFLLRVCQRSYTKLTMASAYKRGNTHFLILSPSLEPVTEIRLLIDGRDIAQNDHTCKKHNSCRSDYYLNTINIIMQCD